MKVYVSDIQSGPIRWLLRICCWTALLIGLFKVLIPDNVLFYSYMFDSALEPLMLGGILLILDLVVPDPRRDARKAKKKCQKLFNAVRKSLPSNPQLFQQHMQFENQELLRSRLALSTEACRDFFRLLPLQQTLTYIYNRNPQAAYKICADLAAAAQKEKSK